MPTALVVTADLGGNVPPILGIARELVARGWRVVVHADAGLRDTAEAAGLEVADAGGPVFDARRPRGLVDALRDYPALWSDRDRGRDAARVARDVGADVAVVDGLLVGTLSELRDVGVRTVAVAHSSWEGMRSFAAGPMGFALARRGAPALATLAAADRLVVASDERLGRRLQLPANARVTGPVLQEAPRAAARGTRPLVLVSLSTVAFPGQRAALQHVLDAVASLPVDVVASAGGHGAAGLRAGANTVVEPMVDHATVMPRARAVVGHGGHATVVRALAHGLPMVLMPMHPMIDQPRIARAVAAEGAAVVLGKSAPVARIAAAVRAVLDEPGYAAAAARLGADFVAARGAARAADEVEAVAAIRV